MLPGMSGVELLRKLRQIPLLVPVIFLTAKDGVTDRVSGLDAGADDYLVKPFSVDELLARIRAALRRNAASDDGEVLTAGEVRMDLKRRAVTVQGESVELTKREYDLLEYLLRNKDAVVTRDQLLEHVWDFDFDGGTNAVDVYIRFLRGKIDEKFGVKMIHTVRGVGYVIREQNKSDE
jgi:DNA-binding response OmpR family regulator